MQSIRRTVSGLAALLVLASAVAAPPDDPAAAKKFVTEMEAKSGSATDREASPGARNYATHCAKCHEALVYKAPARTFIQMLAADSIYDTLTHGVMKAQAAGLSDEERRGIAEYLSRETVEQARAHVAPPVCSAAHAAFDLAHPPELTAWGSTPENTHFVADTAAGLAAADVPRLKLKWAFAFPGALRARSQPTLAYGALFVGSQNGTVYALDAATGCVRWSYRASAEVRSPVVVEGFGEPSAPRHPRAFFGDLLGRAYALDALTGRLLWQHKVDDHPSATITGAPAYHAGRLYVPVASLEEASIDPKYPCCSFRGSVVALDGKTGRVAWKRYTSDAAPREVGRTGIGTPILAPSGAAVWNSPTVDAKRRLLYIGTGDNYTAPANDRSDAIIALDLATGAIRWSWQVFKDDAWNVGCMLQNANCPKPQGPDFDIGAGVMLVHDGARDLLVTGLKSGAALAVDADTHQASVWSRRLGRGSTQGGIQFGMATDGRRVFVPIADIGKKVDPDYPGEPHPGLYALDLESGASVWSQPAPDHCNGEQFCDAGILAAITASPAAVFAGHMDGMLRAYEPASGRVLWEFDTRQDVTTVSGERAHGGSMGGGGPAVWHGMLFVNSGYGMYFHLPGNVLFAFSVDGK
jgi:polyvinyl alcohol dehydrogenase (cytochrome)